MTDFEYDPERAIWKPGRRAFLFLGASAAVGAMLPAGAVKDLGPWNVEAVTEEVAKEFIAARVKLSGYSNFADLLKEVYSRDRIFAPFEASLRGEPWA